MNGFICRKGQRAAICLRLRETYQRGIHVSNQPHDARDLRSSCDASDLAFLGNVGGHPVFVCFEDCRLMQTYDRGVYLHRHKHHIRVVNACRESHLFGQRQCQVEEHIVQSAMPLPEFTIDVVLTFVVCRTVEVEEVTTKHACQDADTCEWCQSRRTTHRQGLFHRYGFLRLAPLECLVGCG